MYQAYLLKIKHPINIRQRNYRETREREKYVSPMALQEVKKSSLRKPKEKHIIVILVFKHLRKACEVIP